MAEPKTTNAKNRPAILVTGGAGYIGSIIALLLAQRGYFVVVVDHRNQATFPLRFILSPEHGVYVQSDIANRTLIQQVCTQYNIIACIHCAAFIEVGESVKQPQAYYNNNVIKSIQLIDTLRVAGVKKIMFSSSCAVYGKPQYMPLDEQHPKNPISPYGRTKLIVESVLQDYAQAYGIQYGILRYFNAAGALPDYWLGERHDPETHLIPCALRAAYTQQAFTIFGSDYQTPDGTCVRDYLHIADLADAHCKTLEYLLITQESIICNLGTGSGYSVQQVLQTIETVTGYSIQKIYAPRRAGDPDTLVASATHATQMLGWKPQRALCEIITSAHQFHQQIYETTNQNKTIASLTKDDIPLGDRV